MAVPTHFSTVHQNGTHLVFTSTPTRASQTQSEEYVYVPNPAILSHRMMLIGVIKVVSDYLQTVNRKMAVYLEKPGAQEANVYYEAFKHQASILMQAVLPIIVRLDQCDLKILLGKPDYKKQVQESLEVIETQISGVNAHRNVFNELLSTMDTLLKDVPESIALSPVFTGDENTIVFEILTGILTDGQQGPNSMKTDTDYQES